MQGSFAVLKFGGTSVSQVSRWETIEAQLVRCLSEGHIPVLVCSALAGVTDALEHVLTLAAAGDDTKDAVDALRARHEGFAHELGVDSGGLQDDLDALYRTALGASLLGEVSPAVRARVLATGELLSTRLGGAWLAARGHKVSWLDARTAMQATGDGTDVRRLLAANVPWDPDTELQARLRTMGPVITQGYIARDPSGSTCVLGRGGSDASAAILAAKLQAARCEIWTDVPGMFTADPRKLPGARLLRALDYAEALEIATTGAKVLHPRALAPLDSAGIPLFIRCTGHPELEGTEVRRDVPATGAQVKALSSRRGLVLVSMETVGMWQQVGFLAEAFATFARHGLSIDTVSTSETNVTVTLDPIANALSSTVLDDVLVDLNRMCAAQLMRGCASVSLVGQGIRSILHRLAPALELFEEQRVHLVSQAASDLNLTFVVNEDTADRLLAKLHSLLFAHRGEGALLGPTWREMFHPQAASGSTAVQATPWWEERRDALLDVAQTRTPAYVYDQATLDARATALRGLQSVDRVLYAMKANPHPSVMNVLAAHGLGFECVSPGEIERVREVVGTVERVLFTPNFATREELSAAVAAGVQVTLDNLHALVHWPDAFAGAELFLRLDLGAGKGHHQKVRTAGAQSKFGIALAELEALPALISRAGCKITGLHSHAGSGVLEPTAWQETAARLAEVAATLPDVRVLDLGGGLGVPERPGEPELDLAALDDALMAVRTAHPGLQLWIEPGRYLVSQAGVLLARVTQTKTKGPIRYVGVDAGMHTLIRPALYGAYHHVVNLSRLGEPAGPPCTVVGPICETGDVLARDRRLADPQEGDVLLFTNAGAYGAAMANDYNLRGRPAEVLL